MKHTRKTQLVAILLMMTTSYSSQALIITDELEALRVPDVGNAFQTVTAQQGYADMIVVCTYAIPSSASIDALIRVDNITTTTFDVRVQNPGNSTAVTAADVYCILADEGDWTLPDGTVYDAHKTDSDEVMGNVNTPNWNQANMVNVTADINGTYGANDQPAVLGQVMSYNDTDFSAFTSSDCESRVNPPFNTNFADGICIGKHVGQVSGTAADRETETLGYIVVEQSIGSFDGISYRSALGADSVAGVQGSPPYVYAVGADYKLGAATKEAEDGGDGGWAVFYGSDPLDGTNIDIAIDEETVADSERAHTTEQVAYWIFSGIDHGDAPISYGDASHSVIGVLSIGLPKPTGGPPVHADDADAEEVAQFSAAADGDDNDGIDDENGVVFNSFAGGDTVSADVEITNPKGLTVNVCAWLDIVAGGVVDGAFDAADGICQTTSALNPTLTFQWPGLPNDQTYTTFARFRTTTDAITTADAFGAAADGEVEDYQISFDFQPTAVTLSEVAISNESVSDLIASLDLQNMSLSELEDLLATLSPELSSDVDLSNLESVLDALRDHFDPDSNGYVPLFRWETVEERGTIGFYAERRLLDGSWYRINEELLPGLITAPLGGEYLLLDPNAYESLTNDQVIQYRLIELEANGDLEEYGPFDLQLN